MDGLIEGRIVHFVFERELPDGDKKLIHRPAIITKVWDLNNGCCNMQVFMDGYNDADLTDSPGVIWRTSILYSEEPKPYTWHWIEKK